uniref:Hypothetical_protein n=1 Tax=Oryza brachyantha TaxID=4533 RepID=G2XM31_ORYBR|nr:hypothetical_protein [Oryza brachyantha]
MQQRHSVTRGRARLLEEVGRWHGRVRAAMVVSAGRAVAPDGSRRPSGRTRRLEEAECGGWGSVGCWGRPEPRINLLHTNRALHEFLVGDKTHPTSKKIYTIAEEIKTRLSGHEHRSSTTSVLFDVEEEDKTDTLT